MPELDDQQLLAQFICEGSEAAFGALVRRYVNLVYSTARRSLGHEDAAEEVSQAVFVILARKAGGLSPKVVLSGWLYQTTRLTATNYLRGEIRRRQREQEAYMRSLLDEPTDEAWRQIAPLLDDALDKLGSRDRDAIALRFFENKTLGEVGRALGASEDAAKMRVNRALEKLRTIFKKRGVTLTTALIAGAVSANSVQAAPAGLAAAFTTTAAGGATISATIVTLVKGTMKTMTWLKIKFAVGAGLAAVIAGGTLTVAVSQISGEENITAPEILKKSGDAYAALTSYSDEGATASRIGTNTVAPRTFNIKLARPGLYRVEWRQDSGFSVNKGIAWSPGDGNFVKTGDREPIKHSGRENALASANGISGAAASIPGTFFKMIRGNQLALEMQRKGDEKINGVDCYVLTRSDNGRTRTIWIGKQDFLIRQVENLMSAASVQTAVDDANQRLPKTNRFSDRLVRIGPVGDAWSLETHSNIVVNAAYSPADFAP